MAKQMSQQSLESLGHLEEKSESDDYEEDVSVFEVSPQGSFLVAVVGNEFLSLRFLPKGCLRELKAMTIPSYMAEINPRMDEEAMQQIIRRQSIISTD